MKISLTYFAIITFFIMHSNNKIENEHIFVYETSTKIYGRAYLYFVYINNNKIDSITSYNINYSKEKINKIIKGKAVESNFVNYTKLDNGNIKIEGIIDVAYNSSNFNNEKRAKYYSLICKDFLNLSNKEKIRILENWKNDVK